jgi:hypothetical protein
MGLNLTHIVWVDGTLNMVKASGGGSRSGAGAAATGATQRQ